MSAKSIVAGYLVDRIWYGKSRVVWLLVPLSWLFSIAVQIRAWLYRSGLLKTVAIEVPVIVVGNISVGGTGKTPVTVWLCNQLQGQGYSPAIISRGYGGNNSGRPEVATADSDAAVVGDEAILMARRTSCPVVVGIDRVAAANAAVAMGADIILSDDGLQHYRLGRDYEIVVIDGERGFGNGRLLPAGPLREPRTRLKTVDQILEQRGLGNEEAGLFRRRDDRNTLVFRLVPTSVTSLDDGIERSLDRFAGEEVNAVAAIGNPQRFFDSLEALGIKVNEYPMPDHAKITTADVSFKDQRPVLMTEKDATKCRGIPVKNCWYVPVDLEFDEFRGETWIDYLVQRFPVSTEERTV